LVALENRVWISTTGTSVNASPLAWVDDSHPGDDFDVTLELNHIPIEQPPELSKR